MKPFYQTRLSNGRKIELTVEEYAKHLIDAIGAPRGYVTRKPLGRRKSDQLVRTHLELGGHLKGKSFMTIPASELKIETWPTQKREGMQAGTIPVGVKVEHIPSSIVITCDSERSQKRNLDVCLERLKEHLKG